jgi:hypothetical protein
MFWTCSQLEKRTHCASLCVSAEPISSMNGCKLSQLASQSTSLTWCSHNRKFVPVWRAHVQLNTLVAALDVCTHCTDESELRSMQHFMPVASTKAMFQHMGKARRNAVRLGHGCGRRGNCCCTDVNNRKRATTPEHIKSKTYFTPSHSHNSTITKFVSSTLCHPPRTVTEQNTTTTRGLFPFMRCTSLRTFEHMLHGLPLRPPTGAPRYDA